MLVIMTNTMIRSARHTLCWLGLLLLWTPAPVLADHHAIRIYTWADVMDFSVIDAFEAEIGLRVDYDTYRSREALEARLTAGIDDLDLLMLPDDLFATLARDGQLRALDPARLDNWRHLDPVLLAATRTLDPPPRHGAPFFWGATGLAMDTRAVRRRLPAMPLDTLGLLFEPARISRLADCGIWLLDSPGEVIPALLGYLGEDRTSTAPAVLARVEARLRSVWPHLSGVDSRDYLDRLATGEACLALGWSDGVVEAQDAGARRRTTPVDFRTPREGARLWLDLLAIPANAPHPEAALRLLDFLLRPGIGAQVANYAYLAPANRDSWPLLLPEIRDNPALLPTPPPGGFYTVAPDPATRERWAALWRRLKTSTKSPAR